MAKRKLLKIQDRKALFDIPTDEDSLMRHYSLSPADRLEIEVRRREHNRLGFAVQLCLMRYPGRALMANEILPEAMLNYIAEQIGADPASFDLYARREETRMNHVARLLRYLEMRAATTEDRRAALLAAIEAATVTDKGATIATAIITTFRERRVLLPAANMIERMGLAARAIARRQAEAALITDLDPETLGTLDGLLAVDPAIGQTRYHWLRSAPEAPGAGNLVGLTERIAFLRMLGIDPRLQTRVPSGRWDQMIREGDATPAWLASDFNASRRRATIVAQIIKLGQKLTDDAVMMFIKLMGRLFSQVNNRKKQRHMSARLETSKALRLFLDTIVALQAANDMDADPMTILDRRVGWHRLLQVKPGLEAMVENSDVSPLVMAAEQHATVRKYAGAFLQTFTFRSQRRHDPLLSAVATIKGLYAEGRRVMPDRVPVGHLTKSERELIFENGKPDRRLYEIATLTHLRDRLHSRDVWVEGSRSFRPIDEHLMPKPAFVALKEEDKLGLGVQADGAAWLAETQQMMDFNLKRLAWRARYGKLEGVRMENGTLIVTPHTSAVPAAAEPSMPKSPTCILWSRYPICCGKCMNGRDSPTSSPMSGREMHHRILPPCWPACLPMAPISARNAWRGPRKASAHIRSAGCAASMPAPKPIAPRRPVSPTLIRAIRIRDYGVMEQPLHPTGSSSGLAIGLTVGFAEVAVCGAGDQAAGGR